MRKESGLEIDLEPASREAFMGRCQAATRRFLVFAGTLAGTPVLAERTGNPDPNHEPPMKVTP